MESPATEMAREADRPSLAAVIAAAGIESFGELEVDAAVLARVVDDAVADGIAARQLETYAAEIYLGAACGAGRAAATAALEHTYIARVAEVLAAKRLPPHAVDEVRQTVRERLLLGEPPYIVGAVGRGSLASLIAVIASRAALDWLRVNQRAAERRVDESAIELFETRDPERVHLRTRYTAELKAAFEAAVAELDPRDRTMLRLHLVDHLTVDDVAKLYGVHRATAARHIERARSSVAAATRDTLARTADLDDDDLLELAALITSQLDLSLSRVLAAEPAPG